MKKPLVVFMTMAFLAAMALTASGQQGAQSGTNGASDQASATAPKIMGYDVPPGLGQDGRDGSSGTDVSNLGPTGTGLGVYRGMVFGEFDNSANGEEFACDFGSIGLWVCNSLSASGWHQISGVNPEMIISGHFTSATYDEIVGDFGSLGLWMWAPGAPGTPFPGTWAQLSGVNPVWEFAADDDYDTIQELFVNFGTTGVWHYDYTNGWRIVSSLNPSYGLRMDTYTSGWEEGCFEFGSSGVWRIYSTGSSSFSYQELTGTAADNDNASGKFLNGTAEDLVMDFGSAGLWLLTNQSSTDWHELTTDSINRVAVVHFGTDNPGLVWTSNTTAGLYYWHYAGSFPGTIVQLNATTPDRFGGFVEPFQYNTADSDEELAVDMAASGLWVYEYYGGIWTQISGQDPVCFVAGNWLNDGVNDCLLVNFGTLGLWLYESPSKTWSQMSGYAPDYSITP